MAVEVAGPPDLDGYRHIRRLGRGGFADVYLYEQYRPKREVAVKVLFPDADEAAAAQFTAEADVMAQLSSHAAIVPVYQVGAAADGRPYLAMEYCPGPNLAVRARAERIAVPEALALGIQIAGAVETAHRAGVLHRDIKPHNILTNAFNRPKLTDFGIARTNPADRTETGLSIPWSAPEVLEDADAVETRSDVYSLAATVYTLLAGRAPFEIPGGDNDAIPMMRRVLRGEVPRIDRADVPDRLQQVFARALATSPERRYVSALSLARALQEAQIDLGLPTTAVEVLDATLPVIEGDSEDAMTRVRPIVVVRPEADRAVRTAPRPHRAPAPAPVWEVPETEHQAPSARAVTAPPPVDGGPGRAARPAASRSRRRRGVLVGTVLAAVAIGAVVALSWLATDDPDSTGPADGTDSPGEVVPPTSRPAAPAEVRGERREDGRVEFTWTHPDAADTDRYQWRFTESGAGPQWAYVDEPRLVTPVPEGVNGCIEVGTVRGSQASDTVAACPGSD